MVNMFTQELTCHQVVVNLFTQRFGGPGPMLSLSAGAIGRPLTVVNLFTNPQTIVARSITVN